MRPPPEITHGCVDRQRNDRLGVEPAPPISILAAGITPTQTVGHPLAPLMHRLGDTAPHQCGPEARSLSGVELMIRAF